MGGPEPKPIPAPRGRGEGRAGPMETLLVRGPGRPPAQTTSHCGGVATPTPGDLGSPGDKGPLPPKQRLHVGRRSKYFISGRRSSLPIQTVI